MRTYLLAYLFLAWAAICLAPGCSSDSQASKAGRSSSADVRGVDGEIEAEILKKDEAIFDGMEKGEMDKEIDQAMNEATTEMEKELENDIKLGDDDDKPLKELEAEADEIDAE